MSAVVIEATTGAQVLPEVRDERAITTAWIAHLACDADLRTRVPQFAAAATVLKLEDRRA